MRVSVLIIARNEQRYIRRCIESALNQTHKAEEIVVIVHNSTDKTEEIAIQYPITVIPFNGAEGIVAARLEGLKHVSGELILCIDGDSYAARNWIEVMVKKLQKGNILVGSRVLFKGTLFGKVGNLLNKESFNAKGYTAAERIWGPSLGFWQKDKELVERFLQKSIGLSQKLNLSRNPDDYWLALLMHNEGPIEVTNETFVVNNTKETNSWQALERNVENIRNAKAIAAYFKDEILRRQKDDDEIETLTPNK